MIPLPHSPLDSLHIFLPGALLTLLLVLLLGLAVLLAWWWLRRRRKQKTTFQHPAGGESAQQADGSAFAQLVLAIRDEHLARTTYRDGCHALSAVAKTELERGTGADAEEMTVDEIAAWLKAPDIESFFTQLRRLQFGKQPPDRDDFKKMCRDAPKVLCSRTPHDRRA